jgi:hypothetical protein
VTFIVSPLWGALADITKQHKYIMLLTFIGSILSRSSLIFKSLNVYWIGTLVAASAILNAPVKPLIDAVVMAMLSDKATYGKSRLFGQLGFGFGSFIVTSFLSTQLHYIFIIQILLAIPTTLVMLNFSPKINTEDKQQTSSSSTSSATALANKNKEISAAFQHLREDKNIFVFFNIVFLIGLSSGICENFAYVRIAEMGGSSSVMGKRYYY